MSLDTLQSYRCNCGMDRPAALLSRKAWHERQNRRSVAGPANPRSSIQAVCPRWLLCSAPVARKPQPWPGRPYHRSMLRNVSSVRIKDLASVQYVGLAGISASCHDAVKRMVQFGDRIERARLLTCKGQHALLLTMEPEELIVVKSGFSSGYGGEGPRTLAEVLRLLDALSVEIEECEVSDIVLEHVEASALTVKDLEAIQSAPPVRPRRWHDYIYDVLGPTEDRLPVWGNFRPVMPWAIIDRRIIDLALQFSDRPDDSILRLPPA